MSQKRKETAMKVKYGLPLLGFAVLALLLVPTPTHAMYVDGMNLYQYVQSNPVNRVDPMGTWSGTVHADITMKVAGEKFQKVRFTPAMDDKTGKWVVKQLQAYNKAVDSQYFWEMKWHYNSDYIADRWNPNDPDHARWQRTTDRVVDVWYAVNISMKRDQAASLIAAAKANKDVKTNCQRSLEILGNLDHAYQDFFSHAMRESSKHIGTKAGEKRTGAAYNSKWDGFEIWSKGGGPDPDNRGGYLPSSYAFWHDEAAHPGGSEPVVPGSDEAKKREKAAIEFQTKIYTNRGAEGWSIQAWWSACCQAMKK